MENEAKISLIEQVNSWKDELIESLKKVKILDSQDVQLAIELFENDEIESLKDIPKGKYKKVFSKNIDDLVEKFKQPKLLESRTKTI